MLPFNIDLILLLIFAAGFVGEEEKKRPNTQIITKYCNTISVLILITYKESSAQPVQPGAQPEVLSRALQVAAQARLVTKGDQAFAVRAPNVCK